MGVHDCTRPGKLGERLDLDCMTDSTHNTTKAWMRWEYSTRLNRDYSSHSDCAPKLTWLPFWVVCFVSFRSSTRAYTCTSYTSVRHQWFLPIPHQTLALLYTSVLLQVIQYIRPSHFLHDAPHEKPWLDAWFPRWERSMLSLPHWIFSHLTHGYSYWCIAIVPYKFCHPLMWFWCRWHFFPGKY